VVTVVGLLRTRIVEPWTLVSLAGEVHLSRSQLVRAFDATVGISPMAYLRQMRVERMARLLVSTDLWVAEAARSVGRRNQVHASQCFHAAYGVSPTEFVGGVPRRCVSPNHLTLRVYRAGRTTYAMSARRVACPVGCRGVPAGRGRAFLDGAIRYGTVALRF
jgi:AraC-like DNA-binding protein